MHADSIYVLNAGGFDADSYVSWPIFVAAEKGFFAKEGIQTKLIRTDKAMMGLLAGSLDVINAGTSTTMLAAEKGARVIIPYILCERPAEYLALRKPLTRLSELEGETVGIYQVPSTVQLFIKNYLQKNGVNLSKINFRATGGSRERLASLLAGQSSATLLSTTYAYRAQKAGLKLVTSPADWEKIPWNVITFRKPWAETNSGVVVNYLRAVHRAISWLYDPVNFNDALRILVTLSRLDDDTVRWGLKSSIDNKIYNLNKPDPESFQTLRSWLISESLLSKQLTPASLIDTKYYDQATTR